MIYCPIWYTVLYDILSYMIYCPIWYNVLYDILSYMIYCPIWYTVLYDILSCTVQYSWWLNDLVFLGVWLSVPLYSRRQTLVALRTTVNPSDQLRHWHSISVTEWFSLTGNLCPTLSHAFYIHNIMLKNVQMFFSLNNRFHSYELVNQCHIGVVCHWIFPVLHG